MFPKLDIWFFCLGGSLRARMTNNGNERNFFSAHFDTYVGFQNGVKNCLNTFQFFRGRRRACRRTKIIFLKVTDHSSISLLSDAVWVMRYESWENGLSKILLIICAQSRRVVRFHSINDIRSRTAIFYGRYYLAQVIRFLWAYPELKITING